LFDRTNNFFEALNLTSPTAALDWEHQFISSVSGRSCGWLSLVSVERLVLEVKRSPEPMSDERLV
jgi:hypothetical protein